MIFSPSASVYESDPGNISDFLAEVDSTRLIFRAISVARVVARASTESAFRSVSGADNFVGYIRGPATANASEDAATSTLCTRQT